MVTESQKYNILFNFDMSENVLNGCTLFVITKDVIRKISTGKQQVILVSFVRKFKCGIQNDDL